MFNECSTSVQQNKKKSKSKSKSKIENKKNISTSVDLGAFCSSELMPIVEDWLQYKKERNESYKGASGIKAFINNLDLLSDGEPTRARLIINQSMANNWAGIFELKNSQCAAITHDGNLGPSERIDRKSVV